MIQNSFRESKEEFQRFLAAQNLSSDLLWLFHEDLIVLPNRFLVKLPLPRKNETLAKRYFDFGRERNSAIGLQAICLLNGKVCCYIQLVENDVDAQYSLMSNEHVKLSVRTNMINAEPVTSFLQWQYYCLVEKFSGTGLAPLHRLPLRRWRFYSAHSEWSFTDWRSS